MLSVLVNPLDKALTEFKLRKKIRIAVCNTCVFFLKKINVILMLFHIGIYKF